MNDHFFAHLQRQIEDLRANGLYKNERLISSPQGRKITIDGGKEVLNFCANNYLGLADNEEVIEAAKASYQKYGFGLASVRFICGTQTVHKELEQRLSNFLKTEDTLLYSSCFDANTGLFEAILEAKDAVISDALNHASIIDGIRLCKAKRMRYASGDMADLELRLQEARESRFRLIVTDGVFSMDGRIANLKAICNLADHYQALVMVDDCHGVGFMGQKGRGTPEYCGVEGRIDILTGTLGKAIGGASGGYVSGRKAIVEWLRQRSRPYLFSNAVAPSIAAASLKALNLVESCDLARQQLVDNSAYFRKQMSTLGFSLLPGSHPIIPIMLGEAALAEQFATRLLEEGIYVVGFSYPVVPAGQARIRAQLSALHGFADIDCAVNAFKKVGKKLGVI